MSAQPRYELPDISTHKYAAISQLRIYTISTQSACLVIGMSHNNLFLISISKDPNNIKQESIPV